MRSIAARPRTAALLLVALVAAAVVVLALASAPARIAPARGSASGPLELRVGWALRDVRVRLDGRDVTARVRRDGSRLRVTGGVLGDGRHTVRVTADSALPFGATTTRGWAFVVDTTAPRLGALAAPRTVRADQFDVSGRTEPGATVKASGAGGQRADAVAGRDGRHRFAFRLGEGTNVVRLAVSDTASNIARATRRIVRDTCAPRLALAASHGCIRMRIADVEQLFRHVRIGTPIRIHA